MEGKRKKAKVSDDNMEEKRLNIDIKELQDKCASLKGNVNYLDARFIELAKQAEEKNDIKIIIEGNALKRKSEDKRVEMKTLEGLIENMEDKRRKLK